MIDPTTIDFKDLLAPDIQSKAAKNNKAFDGMTISILLIFIGVSVFSIGSHYFRNYQKNVKTY